MRTSRSSVTVRRLFDAIARRVMGTITHVSTQDPVIGLTFDDGPHPSCTPRLLDVLDQHGAHATFFVLGRAAQCYPAIVQRIARAGHAIGSHGWDHSSFPLVSRPERLAQIRAWERATAPYGQRLFRPPYGHQSVASRLDLLLLGYRVVTWSLHAYDWLDHDAEWMADRIVTRAKPGSIILFHDVLYHVPEERYADREPMLEAVDILLERLWQFDFVTLPQLFRHGRSLRRNWYWRADAEWLNTLHGPHGKARRYDLPVDHSLP